MNGIDVTQLEWLRLTPLIILLLGGTFGIMVEAFVDRRHRFPVQVGLTLLTIVAALVVTMYNWARGAFGVIGFGTFSLDGPAYFLTSMVLVFGVAGLAMFAERQLGDGASAFVASASTVPGSPLEREAERQRREHTEIFPLLVFVLLGMVMFLAANDLLTMFVSLEIFSLPLYLLTGMARRRRLLSQEAALKYFLLGSFASAFFLFGTALLYGYSGAFELGAIADAISVGAQPWPLLAIGMVLVGVGLLFKISAVPFHSWTPDAYTGAPTPVTAFMSVATKTAAVGALLRVFYVALGGAAWDWQPMIAAVAVLTMAVGSVIALVQNDIKRMLAYSAIAHAGFILVGAVGAVPGFVGDGAQISSVGAIIFYLLTYGLATFGAFAIVTMVRNPAGEANSLDAWRGIGRRNPVVAGVMTLFMLSFAGIPLTAGFIGKLAVFAAAWAGGYGWLVLVAVLMSVVAAYFYLRVVVAMWFQDPVEGVSAHVRQSSLWTWSVLVVATIGTIVLGILPGGMLDLAANSAQFLR